MSELIAVNELIKNATKKGIDLGKGDPYNRLRYYTKIGWLPHMIRKTDTKGKIEGHYPEWVLGRLELIDKLKAEGHSNEEISLKIKTHNIKTSLSSVFSFFDSPVKRNQAIIYASFILLLIILLSELGVISNKSTKTDLINSTGASARGFSEILDSGSSLFPGNAKTIFIKSNSATSASKIYFTFTDNYSPATRYWVEKVVPFEGFYIELDAPIARNSGFSWWISN